MANGNDWKVVSETPESKAGEWQVVSEAPTSDKVESQKVSKQIADTAKKENAPISGVYRKIGRGAALGLAQGLGIPETEHPVTDLVKNLESQGREQYEHPLKSLAMASLGPAPMLYGMLRDMAGSGKEAVSGLLQKDPEKTAHGASSFLTRLFMLKGMKDALQPAEAEGIVPGGKSAGRTALSEVDTKPPASEFQPALANTQREVMEHASKEGINLTPAQATKAPLRRVIQAVGERSLLGANKLSEGMEANAGAFLRSVRNMADRADPKVLGLSEESAGEAIQQAAETAKSVAHENASNAYKNINWMGSEQVNPSAITSKWVALRERLPMGAEEQIVAQVPRSMKAIVEELLSPTGMKAPLTFDQAISLRSFFRELGETTGLPNSQQGIFRQMAETVDGTMENAAKKIGGLKEWREANKGWKDYVQKYGDRQSPLYKILKQNDPRRITREILNRGSAKDIAILKNEGMTAAIEPLKRQVIEDVVNNRFRITKNGLGGYSNSFLRELFGPQELKELYLKADIGRRFQWEMNPSGTSNVMLGESQLQHPSKWFIPMGAAKLSMPRDPLSYLPKESVPTHQLAPPMMLFGQDRDKGSIVPGG